MHGKLNDEQLNTLIEHRHFVRAAFLAERMGLPENKIRNLQQNALGQMAVIYRNAIGAKKLAQQYELSREDVKQILKHFSDNMKKEGNLKPLEPCHDYRTGKYLSFEEWINYYLKIWEKL